MGSNRVVLWHQHTVPHDVFCHAHGCLSGHVTGFPIRYRFDGNIFNLRRLQAKPKVQTDVLDELLYADDMDKNPSSVAKCQKPWIKSTVM